jgi:phosphoribosylformimino-5-aminoimidazole carboxamide ribotide isomerase
LAVTIIPSIDILEGQCVRLTQGDYSNVTVYDKDPAAVARRFEQAGAGRIHVVDLDAARGDRTVNRKKIRKIRRAVSCTIQLGGGIRSDSDIEELLDLGIDRLVLGTTFARKPELMEGWSAHYGRIFLAGIDAREGTVYVSGWEDPTPIKDLDLARKARDLGACGIIYTNIEKDGTLSGPDIERTNLIAESAGIPVILSGGIGDTNDVESVAQNAGAGVVGIITGKAVYEDRLDLDGLLKTYPAPESDAVW